MTTSRFHEMTAESPTNLINLINGFRHFKHYLLCPAFIDKNGQVEPDVDLGILKKELTIKEAWEISEHDLECVAIMKGDNPIIPVDIIDAPITKLLEKKNR